MRALDTTPPPFCVLHTAVLNNAVLQPAVLGMLMLLGQATTRFMLPEHDGQLPYSFITFSGRSSIIALGGCIKAVLTAGVGTKGVGGGGTGW